ncbi:anhydro-N-acetylmuramic acid kinase [uncultured Eudoraea sp.]|uniref:anhydro-N-acetylmuramic acid kinase n=1 Tax=uncultured Eudoraea sp. TaxID=1035614 RepID=UPI00261B9798|nr:anhydro-N-acetylmuramic acid kinase [uncultured Eudoraea sp.]
MKIHKVLGLMSGTSLDGLDLAYCHIWKKLDRWKFEIKETRAISYDADMRSSLQNSIDLPADELLILHNTYGSWLGQQAREFIEEKDLEVDIISSHGHTTHHQPEQGLTFQIGSGQHLANVSRHKVVCDFRSNDVSLGGEGAPLVPIGDLLFFGNYDFCLNLGGIANVSFEYEGKRIAYDIGLANMILNHITQKIGLSYDNNGMLASKGSINNTMLEQLNELSYYKLPFPKSTGYEWFVEKVLPVINAAEDTTENLLHTAVHHICEQVAMQIKMYANKDQSTLFVTGGGALNQFMMELLQLKLAPAVSLVIPSKKLIEYKEALIFALMGILRVEQEINVLKTVTGASKDSSSGVIYLPA